MNDLDVTSTLLARDIMMTAGGSLFIEGICLLQVPVSALIQNNVLDAPATVAGSKDNTNRA